MRYAWMIAFVCILILLIGFGVYHHNVGLDGISSMPEKWGVFGDFSNVLIGICNLILVFWFSFAVYRYNTNRDRSEDINRIISERPLVIFRPRRNSLGEECWEAHNIGRGPALNLKIAELQFRKSEWETTIRCYSLGNDGKQELPWTTNSHILIVHYTDLFNINGYYSLTAGDETHVLSERQPSISVDGIEYDEARMKTIIDRNSERMAAPFERYFNREKEIKKNPFRPIAE